MKKNFMLLALMMIALLAQAQTPAVTSVPYAYSFEDDEMAEWANWTVNPGTAAATCADEWVRGKALHSDGEKGLYASNDGGETSCFGGGACIQFAYRDFVLADGHYYISFDWMGGNDNTSLRWGWLGYVGTSTQAQNFNAVAGSTSWPNVGSNYQELSNGTNWQTVSRQLDVTNPSAAQPRVYRVYFAWVSNQVDSAVTYAAAIDNIQITDARCARPENIEVEVFSCEDVQVRWQGGSTKYQVQYRKAGAANWRTRTANNVSNISLSGIEEGNYDFRVRGICYETDETGHTDTIFSPYTTLANVNIFCPDAHCVNYINLTDTTKVHCYYGTSSYAGYTPSIDAPFQNEGVQDFGAESVNSRHTVVWDTLATDPRTGDMLKMVPTGASASVRLGNWNYNYGCEAIRYKFDVDPEQSILLMKYAIVLENPSGHNDEEMPRFVLEIQDEMGNPIDPDCGRVDLNPLNGEAGWQEAGSGYNAVVWKDWTTLGINMDQYVGRTIQVCVMTYDCFLGGHYGYAYFTFDCASAHIKNTSCGAETLVEVEAPMGFNYTWWETKTGTVRSNERTLIIGLTDPTDWTCTLSNVENPACTFDLTVNTQPRYPKAGFYYTYEPANCENRVTFTNTSYILVNNDGVVTIDTTQTPNNYRWDFGFDDMETDEENPSAIVFPEAGGTFVVSLAAMIGDGTGTCFDEVTDTIVLPALGPERGRTDTAICEGNYIVWKDGKRYYESGEYPLFSLNRNGCEVIDTLFLTVVPTQQVTLPDTAIYSDQTICLGDDCRQWNDSGEYQMVAFLQNYLGCDSTVILNVNVSIRPCYGAIYQRWNDVLSLKKEEVLGTQYPGDHFQWYRNGQLLPGETKSYIYVAKGLVIGDVYDCVLTDADGNMLTRTDEHGVVVEAFDICDFTIVDGVTAPQATTQKRLMDNRLYIERDGRMYNVYGARVY